MNDRYLYLPCVPFFAAFVAGCVWLVERLTADRPAFRITWRSCLKPALPAVAAFGFALASVAHLPVWRNDVALWEATWSRLPHVPVVRIQYAWMLHHQGRTAMAIEVLEATLEQHHPDDLDRVRIQETINAWQTTTRVSGREPIVVRRPH